VRAAAAVSIHSADGTIGIFILFSDRETSFGSRRMEALRVFAGITALEIHRRRELAGLVAQRADARAMLEVAKGLSRHIDEAGLLAEIVAYSRAAAGASFGVAWRLSGNLFESAAIDGDDGGRVEHHRRHAGGEPGIIGMADPDAGDVGQEIALAWRHGGSAFRVGSGGAAMESAAAETIPVAGSIGRTTRERFELYDAPRLSRTFTLPRAGRSTGCAAPPDGASRRP